MKKKKWLFVLLFAWVVLIDWINGTQNGYYRAVAVNSVGILMGILTLRCYPYEKEKYKRVDIIWLILWLLGSIIGSFVWTSVKGPVNVWQYILAAVDVGILGFTMVRVIFTRFWKKISWKKEGPAVLIFTTMSLLMVFSRYYEIWQIWFWAVFMCFYLTQMDREEEDLMWDAISKGVILAFFAIQIWAYGFRPYDEVRYKGPYNNTNMAALFYLITYMMVLYRIHVLHWKEKRNNAQKTKSNTLWKAFYYILAGGLISFIIFTICRTALLVVIGLSFFYGIISNRILMKETIRRMIVRWGAILLSAVITFPCVYGTIRYLPCILHRPVWFESEYNVDKVHSTDTWDSWKYVSLEEFFEEAVGRMGLSNIGGSEQAQISTEPVVDENIKTDESTLVAEKDDSVSVEIQDASEPEEDGLLQGADALNSGKIRLRIWKEYISALNINGHTVKEGQIQITKDFHAWHGQNIFIQTLFYYGIIAGILFALLMGWYGFRSVKLIATRKEPIAIMPFMVFAVFMAYGMLEAVWYPGQAILILMYVVAKLLLQKGSEISNRD